MGKFQKPPALPRDHPMAARKTLRIIDNKEGKVIQVDPVNFAIQTDASDEFLLPVNLPEDFQQEGIKVIFSGKVKEVGLNELMPGHPLILTELVKKKGEDFSSPY